MILFKDKGAMMSFLKSAFLLLVYKSILFCIRHVTLPGGGSVMTQATDRHEGEGGLKVA